MKTCSARVGGTVVVGSTDQVPVPAWRRAVAVAAVAAWACVVAPAARAGSMLAVGGTNFPGQILAEVTLDVLPATQQLQVTLVNTSDPGLVSATITGFAFNAPAGVTGITGFTASGTGNDAGWGTLVAPGGVPGNYGFDLGLHSRTNNNNLNGQVAHGLALGHTATFTLDLGTIAGLSGLAPEDFLALPSSGAHGPTPFAVRFQGVGPQDGSDLALPVVPSPAAAGVAAMGAGLLFGRRRRHGSRCRGQVA